MGHWEHFPQALYPKGTSCWPCLESEFHGHSRTGLFPEPRGGVDLVSGLAPSRVPFSLWEEGHSDTWLSFGDSMQTERC